MNSAPIQPPTKQSAGAAAIGGTKSSIAGLLPGIEGHQKQVHGQSHAQAGILAKNQVSQREIDLMKQYEAMKAQGRVNYQPYDTAKQSETEFYSETNMTPFRTK